MPGDSLFLDYGMEGSFPTRTEFLMILVNSSWYIKNEQYSGNIITT